MIVIEYVIAVEPGIRHTGNAIARETRCEAHPRRRGTGTFLEGNCIMLTGYAGAGGPVLATAGTGTDGATDAAAGTPVGSVAVVGLGYVGLPTALAFDAAGIRVVGVDVSAARIEEIHTGTPDLLPQDADRLTAARTRPDRFRITADPALIAGADAVVVAVPTPVDAHAVPDLQALRGACATVVEYARPGQTLILTSTSYAGSTRELLVEPLRRKGFVPGEDIHVAFAPERIDPGNSVFEQARVPRVVSGATPACAASAARALAPICGGTHLVSGLEVAELAKLLENTFRAVNISLANEFAVISGRLGVDPAEVVAAAATKPFGFMPFHPGRGVGGHCIPCDPHYLLWQLRRDGHVPRVISAAMDGIRARPHEVVTRAAEVLAESGRVLSRSRVLVSGIAYKPDVEDVRESPALEIISGLAARGAEVAVHDPHVPSVRAAETIYLSVDEDTDMSAYDLVVVCVRHSSVAEDTYAKAPLVLDATYSLPAASNRRLP
ncbi:MAG: nucleotide sugar dehydrogenase [Kineosporiaceae bacterium]